MRRLICLTLLAFLACGSPSGPEPEPVGTPALAIVAGDSQTVTVTDTLPFDAEVRVMREGNPVTDQLVDWRVLEDNAGTPFVSTTRTGSEGLTRNRVVAGTRAWTHPDLDGNAHMEVRWIEQSTGEAIVDTTITYRVLPGEVSGTPDPGTEVSGPSPLTLPGDLLDDQYDNPALWRAEVDSVAHIQSSEYGERGSWTLVADSAGRAVVCLAVADSVVWPGLVEVSEDGFMRFSTQGDPDPTNGFGEVQLEDCR